MSEGDVFKAKAVGKPIYVDFQKYEYVKLSRTTKDNGYQTVSIDGKSEYLHRIVAEAFYGEPGYGMEVDHLNGVRDDNRSSNLEWVTSKENNRRMREKHGLIAPKSLRKAISIYHDGYVYESIGELARTLKIDSSYISRAIKDGFKVRGHKVHKINPSKDTLVTKKEWKETLQDRVNKIFSKK